MWQESCIVVPHSNFGLAFPLPRPSAATLLLRWLSQLHSITTIAAAASAIDSGDSGDADVYPTMLAAAARTIPSSVVICAPDEGALALALAVDVAEGAEAGAGAGLASFLRCCTICSS